MLTKKALCLCFILTFSFCFYQTPHSNAEVIKLDNAISLTQGWIDDKPYKPKVAFNSNNDEYLVVYHWSNAILFPWFNRQVHAARLSEDGKYIANYIISDLPNGCALPDVAYDPVNDRYLVVWMYDKNGDGSDWNVHGRFVPTGGPIVASSSFPISELTQWDEYSPRLAYGNTRKDFAVVVNLLRNDGSPLKPYIGGFQIEADGSGLPMTGDGLDFSISRSGENIFNPDLTYNTYLDEYMVVYDNIADIYANTVNGVNFSVSSGIAITELTSPYSPLAGSHDRPAIAFSLKNKRYVITWDTDRLAGQGKIYSRIYPGGDLGTTAAHIYRIDDDFGGVRPDFTSSLACNTAGECLIVWTSVHNNTFFTFGRQIHADTVTFDNGFPFDNLSAVSLWGSENPHVGVAAGSKNFMYSFESITGTEKRIYARHTLIPTSFPWTLFLPAIINKKSP